MDTAGRNLSAELFGTGSGATASPWTRERIEARIRSEAKKAGVDPELAIAVAMQESEFNPNAVGDNGNSLGLFQLQPAAAKDVGIPSKFRQEPGLNIHGGVTFLKQKLDQSKGNTDEALRRYNGGGDPNYVQNVMRWFKPGVAEAATRPAPGLDLSEELFGTPGVAEAATRPAPGLDLSEELFGTPGAAEPPSDLTVNIEKPSPSGPSFLTPQPETPGTTQEERMAGVDAMLERERARANRGVGTLAVQGGSTVAGAIGGAAVGGVPGMITGGILGAGAGTRITNTLGLTEPETPLLETPVANLYPSDVLNVGASALMAIPSVVRSVLARSQAGKAIVAADKATQVAQQEWRQAAAAATREQQAGRAEAYHKGLLAAREMQVRYQQRVRARETTIAANKQTYQTALQAYQTTTQARQQRYQQAVTQQGQAITTARAVPGRYMPQTPSWMLYEQFGDVAKDATVSLAPAKTGLRELRASRGVLPTGEARPLPSAVATFADSLEAGSDTVTVQTVRDQLRGLGPLTRSPNGEIRGAAKQLHGIYNDALEASALQLPDTGTARALLLDANATFRKEMALQDVHEWLRPGHGVIRIDQQGRETFNVGNFLTKLEKTVADDTLFAGSFAPDELQAIRRDFGNLAGTPLMPHRPPVVGTPPTALATPPEVPRPRPELLPGSAGPGRQTPPVPPEPTPVTPREALGEQPPWKGRTTTLGGMAIIMHQMGVPLSVTGTVLGAGAVHVAQQQGRYWLAAGLLSPRLRPLVMAAIDSKGTVNPRLYGAILASMTAAEKKAYERATRNAK